MSGSSISTQFLFNMEKKPIDEIIQMTVEFAKANKKTQLSLIREQRKRIEQHRKNNKKQNKNNTNGKK